jgi:type III secretion system YscQ/HrcQ family protein
MAVRPFPYASLPKLTHRQRLLSTALRTCWGKAQAEQALAAVRGLLGRELTIRFDIGAGCSARELALRCPGNAAIGVLIERAEAARPITCVLELTHHAAQQLVDVALGGDASGLTTPNIAPLDELSRGALAYLSARVLAALGGGFQLRGISELPQLEAALPELVGDCVVCPIVLQLGQIDVSLRLYVPERLTLQSLPERAVLRNLEDLRVSLCAHAGSLTLPHSELRQLAQGDVIVLDETSLERQRGEWRGQVAAGLHGSRTLLQCAIEEQGLRVQRSAYVKEQRMSTGHIDKASGPANSSVAADAAIELQVEVARFSLSLGELQRLQEGDVLTTGRRIGERVSVRVGSRAFAEGELVDVEGEIGVRLLSFSEQPQP